MGSLNGMAHAGSQVLLLIVEGGMDGICLGRVSAHMCFFPPSLHFW